MAVADRRTKDQAMAARMKSEGVTRTSARCPICHGVIALVRLYNHISHQCGGRRNGIALTVANDNSRGQESAAE